MYGARLFLLIAPAVLAAGCAAVGPRDPGPPDGGPPPVVIVDVQPPPESRPLPPPGPSGVAEEAAPAPDASLAALTLSSGALDQPFQAAQASYTSTQDFLVTRLRIRAETGDPQATVAIGGAPPAKGRAVTDLPLAVGTNRFTIAVTAADGITLRIYRLEVERRDLASLAQRSYAKASNTDGNDLFGYSLALDGDTLAVGAYLEASYAEGIDGDQGDNSADGSGAVYVFARHGDDWLQQAYIKGIPAGGGRQFGRALALAGDTLAVGAPFDGHGGAGVDPPPSGDRMADSGAVHVFRRSGGVWRQEAYIKADNAAPGDLFGSSVALAGDVLAVGAYMEDGGEPAGAGAEDSGAVYVFARRDGRWSQQAYLKAANAQPRAGFGYSVALSGDTLAIGAHLEADDAATAGSGAVHVYERSRAGWSPRAHLRSPRPARNDLFGSRVALDGDTLAVGAHLEDGPVAGEDTAENSGAVYVYVRRDRSWSQQAYLKAKPGGTGHRFGLGLALSGDTLAVGAYLEDSRTAGINPPAGRERSAESGAVYLYTRSGGTWSQQAHIKASNARAGDMFGYSVALSGGLLAVGAPIEASGATGTGGDQTDAGAPGSGAVYVFR